MTVEPHDVLVETEPPDPDEHDDGGEPEPFGVFVTVHPPRPAPIASASVMLAPDAPVDDVAAALLRTLTAAAQAHSSDLLMAVYRQIYAGPH